MLEKHAEDLELLKDWRQQRRKEFDLILLGTDLQVRAVSRTYVYWYVICTVKDFLALLHFW